MKRIHYIGLVAVAGFLVVAVVLLWPSHDPVERQFAELRNKPGQARQIPDSVLDGLKFKDLGEGAFVREGELTFEQMVAALRQRYGKHMNHASGRRRMLEELIAYLRKKYPETWPAMLRDILGAAFPEQAEKLFRLSENLYKYNKFLSDNRGRLNSMSPEDRWRYLSETRDGIFGEEGKELFVAESQAHSVREGLSKIAAQKDKSVQEKLGQFQETLQKTYGDQLPTVLKNRSQTLVNSFVDVIQDDLSGMDPASRRSVLRSIRGSLGMDGSALERWDNLDRSRDDRWQRGLDYETKRKEIVTSYAGSEREEKLAELRREKLGDQADVVASEEAQGFFRYQRKRRFGRE